MQGEEARVSLAARTIQSKIKFVSTKEHEQTNVLAICKRAEKFYRNPRWQAEAPRILRRNIPQNLGHGGSRSPRRVGPEFEAAP